MPVYKKLVRDLIPEIIKDNKEMPTTRILDDKEYKMELLKKLIEESKEVTEAEDDKNDLIKEIGDVMEVLEAIERAYNLNKEEIIKVKKERKEKRGGFEKQIFLEKTN